MMKKSLLALALRGGGMFTQYLFIFIVARLYGPKEQGSFTLTFTVLQLVAILSQLGLDNRLVRRIAGQNSQESLPEVGRDYYQSLHLTILMSVVISILSWISAPWMAEVMFHKPQLTARLQLMSFAIIPFVLIGLNSSGYRGFKNMSGFLAFKALLPLIAAFILLLFYVIHSDAGAVESYLLSTVIVCLISFIAWYRFSKVSKKNSLPTTSTTWEVIKEAYPMMLTGSIFFILGWTDNLILGIFRMEEEVGIYDTAFKISSISAILLLAINAIQAPSFAELHKKGEHKKLQQQVQSSTKILFWASLPVTVILIIFPSQLLGIFGPAFKVAWPALIILSIGNFVNNITGSIGILLQMTGRQKQYNRIISIAAIGSIVLNFILIPKMGIMGAAISSASAKIFQNLVAAIYVRREMGILSIYLPGLNKIFPDKPMKA